MERLATFSMIIGRVHCRGSQRARLCLLCPLACRKSDGLSLALEAMRGVSVSQVLRRERL